MKPNKENVEAIYPLSPMQQGMLFHAQYAPASGIYFEQTILTLQGELNHALFERAWQQVAARHPILRTAFIWEGVAKPVQVVRRHVELSWQHEDWRNISSAEQADRSEAYLKENEHKGFVLSKAPLMRFALFQTAQDTHEFVWSFHHILLDGWSVQLVLREVLNFYKSYYSGEVFQPAEPRPYRDYIAWLQAQDLTAAELFWRKALQGFRQPTPLLPPALSSYSSPGTENYSEQAIRLSTSITTELHSFARQNQLTLNTILEGIWALLHYRYTGNGDIVFGNTVSGRSHELEGIESVVGILINTLPVRVQISCRDRPLSWLKKLQSQLAEARQYEYTPLVEVQRWSDLPKGANLFDSITVFQNYPVNISGAEETHPLAITKTRSLEKTNYALTLGASAHGQLSLCLGYDSNRFASATISRLLGHFSVLLEGIVANPTRPLSRLPLLSALERQQLLVEWKQTSCNPLKDECIHELIESQTRREPQALAVFSQGEELSYAQLNRRANALACSLMEHGVVPETAVGICVERSLNMVVGMLAILKAGGAYVPLDPAYPAERLAFMLNDTQASVLLAQTGLFSNVAAVRSRVLCFDEFDWKSISNDAKWDQNPVAGTRPENLAYIIYTSGSTGNPKGVMISHRGLVNYASTAASYYEVAASDRFLQFASLNFDASAEEIYCSLIRGATLVLRTDEMIGSMNVFLDKCREWNLSVVSLPTAFWHELVNRIDAEGLKVPDSVRLVIIGGERAFPDRLAMWQKHTHAGLRLVNSYGPTETTVVATVSDLPSPIEGMDLQEIPIGRPLGNLETFVLDAELQAVPIGIVGELHIGGAGLTRGYLNRPELTGEKFIPHPFSGESGARLYKTGDLVRYRSDGLLEYCGRLDAQVKVRGFRIELGEIETELRLHLEVEEALVILREDVPGDKELVACVVVGSGHKLSAKDLRDFLKEKLPSYLIPSSFILVEAFPLTSNGKVDRRKLLASHQAQQASDESYRMPRHPIEQVLAGIWATVLKLGQVGVKDNFFELGGHSLLAMQVISRVREAFQIELPIRSLFANPSIGLLAKAIEAERRSGEALHSPPMVAVPRDQDLPLSFAQQRLWFLDQLEPGSSMYNVPYAVRLQGELDRAALERSLDEIARRHEVLRTTFPAINGHPLQGIAEFQSLKLAFVDFQSEPKEAREGRLQVALKDEARRPFDLQNGPLLRVNLMRLSATEHVLLIVMHHIISDAWTMGILLAELSQLYEAFSLRQPSRLPELNLQYADFANWQREWLKGDVLEDQLAYWKQQLVGIPALLDLPTDHGRSMRQSFHGASYRFTISKELTQSLRQLSRQQNVTLFMTMLAAFQTLLHRYTNQADIVVGSPIAGRNRVEAEALIGFFVNTLPLRANFSDSLTFKQLLKQVREMCLDAYSHQDLPFEKLVEELKPERSLYHAPLFQAVFTQENTPSEKLQLPKLTLTAEEVEMETAKFELSLLVKEDINGMTLFLNYASDLFFPSTIERMAGHLRTLLEGIVANPGEHISRLPLLTTTERRQLIDDWNPIAVELTPGNCLHQLFEAQVERTPEAVALVFEGKQMTYRELNRRANQLARYLCSLGVAPEVLVGIFMERSLDIVVAMLGVIKSGGAYLPLDPVYPKERLAFILQDARASILLTQEGFRKTLPVLQAKIICLDGDQEVISSLSNENLPTQTHAENLAYTIYTSGSTGKPKGTLVTHHNVVRLMKATENWFNFSAADTWTLFHSHAFDFSVWEVWGALIYGGRLVVVPYLVSRSPETFYDLLSRERVTVLNQTPSAFRQLIHAEEFLATRKDLNLRLVIFGGEALELQSLRPWFERHGDQQPQLVNMYGITETTVHVTYRPLTKADLSAGSVIGRPIPDLRIYILDPLGQLVPVGVPGEMYVGGGGLARGYLEQPELTAQKFVPDPFGAKSGMRLYRSGDLARYLPGGDIEYLGRIDHQVKIRGFRVELGEIEAVLAMHQAVREAVAVIREDKPGDKRLVAYVTTASDSAFCAEELRGFMKPKLPDYMIPMAFVELDALPLTANGKLDRRALPAPDRRSMEHSKTFVPPQNATEEVLAGIWRAVLGLDQIGRQDNFFELGGHSLLATQVASRISQAFYDLKMPLRKLFEFPTVAALAVVIEQLLIEKLEALGEDEIHELTSKQGQ